MKIIGTGLSGLVGSRVVELLAPAFDFELLSRESGFDISQKETVYQKIVTSPASWVFHFAAMTDVDAAEKERPLGTRSSVWRVNVEGTRHVVDAAGSSGKHLLYLSTDFVFDGNGGPYKEHDQPNPRSWYAVTKYEGEKIVAALGKAGLILRVAFPYRSAGAVRADFVHRIIDKLKRGERIVAPTDQLCTPTYIDDITHVLDELVMRGASGVYHAVGSQALSPFDASLMIAQARVLDTSKIAPTTWEKYYYKRAPRPRRAVLTNDKIESLGLFMVPFCEGVRFVL